MKNEEFSKNFQPSTFNLQLDKVYALGKAKAPAWRQTRRGKAIKKRWRRKKVLQV